MDWKSRFKTPAIGRIRSKEECFFGGEEEFFFSSNVTMVSSEMVSLVNNVVRIIFLWYIVIEICFLRCMFNVGY